MPHRCWKCHYLFDLINLKLFKLMCRASNRAMRGPKLVAKFPFTEVLGHRLPTYVQCTGTDYLQVYKISTDPNIFKIRYVIGAVKMALSESIHQS